MSDVATGVADDGGRRGKRSPLLHPGEVTKAKDSSNAADGSTIEEPPTHNGRKIGGAKVFHRKAAPVVTPNDPDSSARGLSDIAQLQTFAAIVEERNDSPSGSSAASDEETDVSPSSASAASEEETGDLPRGISLTAMPDWRCYWARLTREQLDSWKPLSGVSVSQFCYGCHYNRKQCPGEIQASENDQNQKVACQPCTVRQKACFFMVSYQYRSSEDTQVADLPNHLLREFDRDWEAAQGTLRSVATVTLNSSASTETVRRSIPRPTIAEKKPLEEIRASSRDLAEILVKDSYFSKPKSTGAGSSTRPYWELPGRETPTVQNGSFRHRPHRIPQYPLIATGSPPTPSHFLLSPILEGSNAARTTIPVTGRRALSYRPLARTVSYSSRSSPYEPELEVGQFHASNPKGLLTSDTESDDLYVLDDRCRPVGF